MCHHIQYTIVKDLKNRGTASKTTCVPYSMKLCIQFYHQFKNGNSVWSFLTHGPSVHQNSSVHPPLLWGEVVTTVSSYCQSNLCQKGMKGLESSDSPQWQKVIFFTFQDCINSVLILIRQLKFRTRTALFYRNEELVHSKCLLLRR